MKKFITFLIAVLYLGVSSGMALQVHYCMDKVAEMTLIPAKSEKCSKCGMSGDDCCRDEVKFLKLQDAHKQSVAGYIFEQPVSAIFREIPSFILPVMQSAPVIRPQANAPPAFSSKRLHIIFCRFNV